MDTSAATDDSVLILGAGVHGAAMARELVLNGVPVHIVDKFDVAYGATSKSSRLIHGGLRYLEYGDFRLVRESLEARFRNLELVPQFVHPLRLYIPTAQRWSGVLRAALGFFCLSRTRFGRRFAGQKTARGFWPTRIGLALYDSLSAGGLLPKSSAMPVSAPGVPRVNAARYRWLCSYSDAQMLYPERLVVALLAETERIAADRGVPFAVSTYSHIAFHGGTWQRHDCLTGATAAIAPPACVINATGAWGDETLHDLHIEAAPMFGGTKGTHFLTWHEPLRAALQGHAVYAEADDGRLVFVLPFGEGVMVGTTDETFAAKPESAVATEEELEYLLQLVNSVMDCHLTRDDITLHYSGVRPLPRSTASDNAAVSRDHRLVEHQIGTCPVLTLVGGKLTTWAQFAHEVSGRVLQRLGRPLGETALLRPVLGAEDFTTKFPKGSSPTYPISEQQRTSYWTTWMRTYDVPQPLIAALWLLYGMQIPEILIACGGHLGIPIHGTPFTANVVRWVIEHEWVTTLSDLIERRLMLVFARTLTRATLDDLADCLISAGKLAPAHREEQIAATLNRLAMHYGRRVEH